MRYTKIRTKENKIPKPETLTKLISMLSYSLDKAGYVTDVNMISKCSLDISQNSACFRIDTSKLGHNARISDYCNSPKGYKRTNIPTWDQRVDFNNIVNACFSRMGLSAKIKSGKFTIRTPINGALDKFAWEAMDPYCGDKYNRLGELYSRILNEKDAREELNSDELEAEHKQKLKEARKAARIKNKSLHDKKFNNKFESKVLENDNELGF